MSQKTHNQKSPLDKVFDQEALLVLERKLLNRFNILTFLDEVGTSWAETAIDPEDDRFWNHDSYLACYNNPQG